MRSLRSCLICQRYLTRAIPNAETAEGLSESRPSATVATSCSTYTIPPDAEIQARSNCWDR
jgi:hypothetical protein